MDKIKNHPILAKEGWLYLTISALVTAVVWFYLGVLVATPLIVITLFILQFFRDPHRTPLSYKDVILAPADGKVICVEKTLDPYQDQQAIKISIFMNVFNVHSNRSPVDSDVVDIQYFKGKFVNADFDKASTDNERNALILKLPNDDKITVVQIAGLVARRILCYTKVGDKLAKGQRFGFIRFGSRVDIYLPPNYTPLVSIGQKVHASLDMIAKYEI
jgi:phosphatidylserine decarboxylase